MFRRIFLILIWVLIIQGLSEKENNYCHIFKMLGGNINYHVGVPTKNFLDKKYERKEKRYHSSGSFKINM